MTQPQPSPGGTDQAPAICPEHQQPGRWTCAQCGKPVCRACAPVAYAYKVYHSDCLNRERARSETPRAVVPAAAANDAPSTGVRVIAWAALVSAILWLGFGLLAAGVTLVSQHSLPFSASLGNPLVVLDEVPGSRALIGWMAVAGLLGAVLQAWIGLGLLNVIPAARLTVLALCWAEVVLAILGWLVVALAQQGFWDIPVLGIGLIVFFSRPEVKKQFKPGR